MVVFWVLVIIILLCILNLGILRSGWTDSSRGVFGGIEPGYRPLFEVDAQGRDSRVGNLYPLGPRSLSKSSTVELLRKQFRVTPVIFITTGMLGYYKGRPIEEWVAKKAVSSKIVPLDEGQDITFYMTRPEELPKVVPELYKAGARIFVGATFSSELLSVLPFLQSHPDVLWMSTASTSPTLSAIDNIFRFVTIDNLAFPLFHTVVTKFFGRRFVLIYNPDENWASSLGQMFEPFAEKVYLVNHESPFPTDLPRDLPIIYFELDVINAITNLEKFNSLGPIIFGDSIAFGTMPSRLRHQYYSLISWLSTKHYAFSVNIFGFPVTPFAVNCLNALRLTSDIYLSRKPYVQQMKAMYGPQLVSYFNDNGDAIVNEIVLTKYVTPKDQWEIIGGSSKNPYQPKYLWLPVN